jgi:hypothetical protein
MATAKQTQKSSWSDGVKGWLIGLTGVLVVVPSLLNAAKDIYTVAAKLPVTDAERMNERLNGMYFGKPPVLTMPVPIKDGDVTMDVRFEIYERGDVRVEFGNRSQWFPFPARHAASPSYSGFSPFSNAFAQSGASPKGSGSFRQVEQIQNDSIVRERTYENGVVEKSMIDPRSGEITGVSSRQADRPAAGSIQKLPEIRVAPVDLDKLRPAAMAGAPAQHWSQGLRAGLAWCGHKDNALSRYLCEYRERARFCSQSDAGAVPECQ